MSFRTALSVYTPLLLLAGNALAAPPAAIFSRDTFNSSQSLAITAAEAALHDQRSIWNIVWSCITTIFACCWVAVHPNMAGRDANFWESSMNRFRHMIWMIIAPELMIFWAIRQWLGARKLKKKYRQDPYNNKGWTKTHGYFLQMGGFMLETRDGPWQILSHENLEQLILEKKLEFPKITEGEIEDRSKLDGLSKAVAIGQTTWFIAQCITRKIQGLITTELELVTVAFAVLNVFIYFFWWNKPMDVNHPVPVLYLEEDSEKGHDVTDETVQVDSDLKRKSATRRPKLTARTSTTRFIVACIELPWRGIKGLFRRVGAMTAFISKSKIEDQTLQIPRFYALKPSRKEHCVIMVVVALIGSLFGALHCIGWNYLFPSHAEAIVWRVSSVMITAVPGAMAFTGAFLYFIKTDEKNEPARTLDYCLVVLASVSILIGLLGLLPYIIARLLLIVEAFISLRQLPPSALLAVRWTAFLPHV